MPLPARLHLQSLILALASIGIAVASAAPATTPDVYSVTICKISPRGTLDDCSTRPLWTANPQSGLISVTAGVRIDARARAPQGVFIKAFAASTVFWDGRLIGRNGKPADSAAQEVPGLRDSVVAIPAALATPGVHRLQLQTSTMRSPLKLASPIVSVSVGPFEGPLQPALRNYLPALLTFGGILIAALYLGFLAWTQKRLGPLSSLFAAALFVTAQLAAESSRAFVAFLYPAQVVRLEVVLLCACGFAVSMTVYLLNRFELEARAIILALLAGLILVVAVAASALDQKVAWAILCGVAICTTLCARAVQQRRPGALLVLSMLAVCLGLGLAFPATFLDRDFYLWALLFLFGLSIQETQRAYGGAGVASSPTEVSPLWVGSGSTRHLVLGANIVRLAAADDYTEVFIAGAPSVLHPEPLHKVLKRLPQGFVRVHRSHAINLAHLESFRRGSRSSVTLSDQSVAPVSRRCVPSLLAAIPNC